MVLPYIDLHPPWVYMCSPSWIPPKLCYTKALEWSRLVPGPEAKSSSEIRNPTLFTISYQTDVGSLISGSSAFSKSSLNIWKFTVHELLKPGLEKFEHYFANLWDACNCVVVWAFFGIAFLWDWNENWPFPVLWPLLSFLNLLAYWVQQFHSIIF